MASIDTFFGPTGKYFSNILGVDEKQVQEAMQAFAKEDGAKGPQSVFAQIQAAFGTGREETDRIKGQQKKVQQLGKKAVSKTKEVGGAVRDDLASKWSVNTGIGPFSRDTGGLAGLAGRAGDYLGNVGANAFGNAEATILAPIGEFLTGREQLGGLGSSEEADLAARLQAAGMAFGPAEGPPGAALGQLAAGPGGGTTSTGLPVPPGTPSTEFGPAEATALEQVQAAFADLNTPPGARNPEEETITVFGKEFEKQEFNQMISGMLTGMAGALAGGSSGGEAILSGAAGLYQGKAGANRESQARDDAEVQRMFNQRLGLYGIESQNARAADYNAIVAQMQASKNQADFAESMQPVYTVHDGIRFVQIGPQQIRLGPVDPAMNRAELEAKPTYGIQGGPQGAERVALPQGSEQAAFSRASHDAILSLQQTPQGQVAIEKMVMDFSAVMRGEQPEDMAPQDFQMWQEKYLAAKLSGEDPGSVQEEYMITMSGRLLMQQAQMMRGQAQQQAQVQQEFPNAVPSAPQF